MAQVVGFDPATSGQQPEDVNGNPIPVGVWGDSDTGGGVFGSSGVLPSGVSIPIDAPAGVEGHGATGPGVVGRSLSDNGVVGESQDAPGVLARSTTSSGLLGVTFSPTDDSHGVFGSSTTGGNGVTGFVGEATGVIGSSVRGSGVRGTTGSTGNAGVLGQTFGGVPALPAGPGVSGSSETGIGVFGGSQSNDGVVGVTFVEATGCSEFMTPTIPMVSGCWASAALPPASGVSLSVMGPDPGCTAKPTAAGQGRGCLVPATCPPVFAG